MAEVIGLRVSNFPGVEHVSLYYRSLKRDKSNALRENKGNFGSFMILSPGPRAELNWRIFYVDTSPKLISHGEPELHIQTGAPAHGWGGVRGEQRTENRGEMEPTISIPSHKLSRLNGCTLSNEGFMWEMCKFAYPSSMSVIQLLFAT